MDCQVERLMEGPDRGWSWVIVFAAFTVSFVLGGIYRSSGTMLVAFMDEFKLSREEAARPLFIRHTILDLAGIIAGPLGQKFGIRTTTIAGALISTLGVSICYFANSISVITASYGVIFGFGNGLVYTLVPVILSQYFVNYRVIATGIVNTGSTFGFVLFPVMYNYLIFTYQLSGCFLLTGGIILHLVISGALMKPPRWIKTAKNVSESSKNSNQTTNRNMTVLKSFKIVLTCPMFYVIALTTIAFYFIQDMFFVINVDYYHDNSIDDKHIRHINIISMIFELTGRLCFGWVMDRKLIRRSRFIMISFMILAAVFLAFPFAKDFILIMLLSSTFYMLMGCTVTVFFILPSDYLESEVHAVAYGCIGFLNGIAELAYNKLIGYFRDNLGSYLSLFFIMGATSAFSSMTWLLERYLAKTVKNPADHQVA